MIHLHTFSLNIHLASYPSNTTIIIAQGIFLLVVVSKMLRTIILFQIEKYSTQSQEEKKEKNSVYHQKKVANLSHP